MEKKLKILSEGTPLVDPEERKKVEEAYLEKINQWRKRKRIFKDLWDAITESSTKDLKEFKVSVIAYLIHVYPVVLVFLNAVETFCRRNLELNMMKMSVLASNHSVNYWSTTKSGGCSELSYCR